MAEDTTEYGIPRSHCIAVYGISTVNNQVQREEPLSFLELAARKIL